MRSRVLGLGLAILVAAGVAGCGSDSDPTGATGAPATHTVSKGGVRHAPGLATPQQSCTACHGSDLQGSGEAPSCYSCHGKKWT